VFAVSVSNVSLNSVTFWKPGGGVGFGGDDKLNPSCSVPGREKIYAVFFDRRTGAWTVAVFLV
jgi:hypothetical protein